MEIEYKLLDPNTLEPSEIGMVYKIIDGSYLLQGNVSKTETIRIDDQTVADVAYLFDLTIGEYVEQSRTERSEPLYTLDDVKASKLTELQAARDAEIYSSFTSTALDGVTPKTYNYDRDAAANFDKKATLLGIAPSITTVTWYTVEDGFVDHTREQFVQVCLDGGAHEETLKMRYFTLEAQVKAAVDIASADAIVW